MAVPANTTYPITVLPFVRDRIPDADWPHGRAFWVVNPTGHPVMDSDLGHALAARALDYMRRDDCTPLLGWVVRDMVRNGRCGAVEIGFLHVFAKLALSAVSVEGRA